MSVFQPLYPGNSVLWGNTVPGARPNQAANQPGTASQQPEPASSIITQPPSGGAGGTVTFDAVGPSASGTGGAASPLTWSHTNNGNGLLVGVTCFTGNTNTVTAVTYGGVSLAFLGYVPSDNQTNGGVALYGKVGGLPTGANTVSVSFSDGNNHNAGSVSVAGAGSLGTAVTSFGNDATPTSGSIATTSGGLLVAVGCTGTAGTWGVSGGASLRWSHNSSTQTGADDGAMATVASAGGSQAVTLTSGGGGDWWGVVAVEVLPGAGGITGSGGLSVKKPSASGTGTVPAGQLGVIAGTRDEVSSSAGVAHSVTSFSPSAGSMARINAAWLDATDQLGKTFTCADNHGNTYSPTQAGGDADGGCYLLTFDFTYPSAPGATTVTITAHGTGATAQADCLIQPYIITGQDPDQSTAARNSFSEAGTATTTYLISLTPTRLGSVIFVLGAPNHNSGLTGPVTANANTVTDVDWDNGNVGSRGTLGRSIAPTAALTATTYGWTSANPSPFGYGVMASEVVPSAAVSFTGSGGAAAKKPSASGSGSEAFTGSGTARAKKPTAASSGTETFPGSGGLAAKKAVASGSGSYTPPSVTGSGGISAKKAAPSGTGAEQFGGSGSAARSKPTAAGSGAEAFPGTGSLAGKKPSASGSGSATGGPVSGSGGLTAKKATTGGTGSETFAGSGSAARGKPVAGGTGSEAFTGSGSAARRKPAATGTGAVGGAAGSGGITAKKPGAAGSGAETFTASGGLAVKKAAVSASGSTSGAPVTGSGGVTRRKPSASGTGSEAFAGSGSAAAKKTGASGAGAYASATGAGGLTAKKAKPGGTGTTTNPGAGGLALKKAKPSGTGAESFTGSGSVSVKKPVPLGMTLAYGEVVVGGAPLHLLSVKRGTAPHTSTSGDQLADVTVGSGQLDDETADSGTAPDSAVSGKVLG